MEGEEKESALGKGAEHGAEGRGREQLTNVNPSLCNSFLARSVIDGGYNAKTFIVQTPLASLRTLDLTDVDGYLGLDRKIYIFRGAQYM